MCKQIHEVVTRWSPATIVGYNSISFDEELIRRAFYSSLLPIFLTNTAGNSRLNVLTLMSAVYAFAPEVMHWPINEKSKVSFKLDRLAPANGFQHENAHDALADVHATIHLARLVLVRAPAIWNAAMAYRTKVAATEYVEAQSVFIATRLRFGHHSSRLVTALGVNPGNSGELFALDLQHDPKSLLSMGDEHLTAFVATSARPVSSIKLNACPVFMDLETAGRSAAGFELGMDELSRRAALVRNDRALRHQLIAAILATRVQFPDSTHVEEQIYGGFYSRADQTLIEEFHRSAWERRFELCTSFGDRRLRILARRLVYCEAPHVMPPEMRADYIRAIACRLHSRTDSTGR